MLPSRNTSVILPPADSATNNRPPGVIGEFKTLFDIWYRLEAKGSGGVAPFVRAFPGLSLTVEAEEVPADSVDGLAI